MHPDAVELPALDHGTVRNGVAELFVKADGYRSAVDDDLPIAELCDPFFRFTDDSAAEVLSPVFGEDDDPAEQNALFVKRVKSARGDRIRVVQQDDVFAFAAVVLIEFLSARYDADGSSPGSSRRTLPRAAMFPSLSEFPNCPKRSPFSMKSHYIIPDRRLIVHKPEKEIRKRGGIRS